ncbi:hypothetical protein ACVC7V_24590 [Hydrogenophaga sp. A37]|uniref:hypothetical protein n=1 Tax=Hydrogenophaga sp. A37 TaxID=1945864 RepID=UPI000986F42F|nr:hypothetical protein [Hydrogenophaga sp. A37]OOG88614.1 hypothetical protein B0E41_01895 [Hydrogenophaga sp. A37]
MQTTPSWMLHAGLLAGLGPRAFGLQAEGDALATDLSFRTCIEAGSGALVAVQAPGARRLHLWTQRPAEPGVQQWTHWLDGQAVGEVLIGAPGWQPQRWGWDRPEHGLHHRAGELAALYRIDADQAADPWFAYHLPRHAEAADALGALGLSAAWATVAGVWETVLGRPLPARSRPWSLSLQGVDGAAPALRVASSLWALVPETRDKCERLAQAVHTLGGDGCFAQALYKLLAPDAPDQSARVIGAALEIGLHPDGSLDSVHFVLRGPRAANDHGGHRPPLH